LLLRRREWWFRLRRRVAPSGLLLLEGVIGPGILARIVKITAVGQSGARSRARGQQTKKQKQFHAGIESEWRNRVNATRNRLRKSVLRDNFFLRQGLWMED